MPLYLEKISKQAQKKVSSAVLVVLTASPSVDRWFFSCFKLSLQFSSRPVARSLIF